MAPVVSDEKAMEGLGNMLGLKEVAFLLGVSGKTIRRRVADGTLPAFRIGHVLRFSEREIQTYLRSARIDPCPRK